MRYKSLADMRDDRRVLYLDRSFRSDRGPGWELRLADGWAFDEQTLDRIAFERTLTEMSKRLETAQLVRDPLRRTA